MGARWFRGTRFSQFYLRGTVMATRTAQSEFLRTMRREARIIVPIIARHRDLVERKEFEARVLSAFGGFTRSFGDGAWRDSDGIIHYDDVRCYDIAMLDTPHNMELLYSLAAYV